MPAPLSATQGEGESTLSSKESRQAVPFFFCRPKGPPRAVPPAFVVYGPASRPTFLQA